MAKKRDRQERESAATDRVFRTGVIDPRAFEDGGTSFAAEGTIEKLEEAFGGEADLQGWGEDAETAPDIFADASDEDLMRASGGHTQQRDEEKKGNDHPDIRRR